jgi:hypothetical protein
MTERKNYPFMPVNSTAPAFHISITSTTGGSIVALESTGVREWQGPGGRSIRVSSRSSDPEFHIAFGTSNLVCTSSGTMEMGGGAFTEYFRVQPSYTHVAALSTAGSFDINITLGYGIT